MKDIASLFDSLLLLGVILFISGLAGLYYSFAYAQQFYSTATGVTVVGFFLAALGYVVGSKNTRA